MAVVSALTLVLIVALIHGSCAIKCYYCNDLGLGGNCDDTMNKDSNDVTERTCRSTENACVKARGKSSAQNNQEGITRSCITTTKSGCHTYNDESVPELGVTGVTGTVCFCTGDLCNAAAHIKAGRMALSFALISLAALAATRLLSQ